MKFLTSGHSLFVFIILLFYQPIADGKINWNEIVKDDTSFYEKFRQIHSDWCWAATTQLALFIKKNKY
jgi:hypothetical protein